MTVPKKRDPSITYLNALGYNVIKLPRVGISPLSLIGRDKTTAFLGDLNTMWDRPRASARAIVSRVRRQRPEERRARPGIWSQHPGRHAGRVRRYSPIHRSLAYLRQGPPVQLFRRHFHIDRSRNSRQLPSQRPAQRRQHHRPALLCHPRSRGLPHLRSPPFKLHHHHCDRRQQQRRRPRRPRDPGRRRSKSQR